MYSWRAHTIQYSYRSCWGPRRVFYFKSPAARNPLVRSSYRRPYNTTAAPFAEQIPPPTTTTGSPRPRRTGGERARIGGDDDGRPGVSRPPTKRPRIGPRARHRRAHLLGKPPGPTAATNDPTPYDPPPPHPLDHGNRGIPAPTRHRAPARKYKEWGTAPRRRRRRVVCSGSLSPPRRPHDRRFARRGFIVPDRQSSPRTRSTRTVGVVSKRHSTRLDSLSENRRSIFKGSKF